MNKKLFIFFLLSVALYAGSDTCYSVQLQSSYTPLSVEKFPVGSKLIKIGRVYTVRKGCFDRFRDAKQALSGVKERYKDAMITSTYKWRFEKRRDVAVVEIKPKTLWLKSVKQSSRVIESNRKDTPKCYTIALSLSKKKPLAKEFPIGTTIIKRGDFFTAAYGCYSKIDDAKIVLNKIHKRRPKAIITFLAKSYFHQNDILPEIKKRGEVSHHENNSLTPNKKEAITFYKRDKNNLSLQREASRRCPGAIESKIIPCSEEVDRSNKAFIWENVDRDAVAQYVNQKLNHEATMQAIELNDDAILLDNEVNETEESQSGVASKGALHAYVRASVNIKNGQLDSNNTLLKTRALNLSLGLTYLYNFTPSWYFYTDDRLIYRIKKSSTDLKPDVKELYVKSKNLFDNNANILIGRKYLKDARGWYYKTSLDTIGISNKNDLLLYELYLGKRLTKNNASYDPNDITTKLKGAKFLFAHVSYEYFKANTIEGFFIHEENKNNAKKLNWRGLCLQGKVLQKNLNIFSYWGDIATMQGDINQSSMKGLGFDIGAKYYFTNNFSALAGSLAYGSGGGSLFVQPSFTNNRSNYLSKDVSFRYYGEFLQPELSNLRIGSLYLLHHFNRLQDKTLIVALHNYTQDKRSTTHYNATNKTVHPGGKKRDIGNEIDVILHYDLIPGTYWRLSGGYFMGGNAYEGQTDKKDGWSAEIYFKYLW